jgi:hypothetical protein
LNCVKILSQILAMKMRTKKMMSSLVAITANGRALCRFGI